MPISFFLNIGGVKSIQILVWSAEGTVLVCRLRTLIVTFFSDLIYMMLTWAQYQGETETITSYFHCYF